MPEGDMMKFWKQTVWSRTGVPPEWWEFRGIFRVVLPLTDVFFAWFGVVGVINGIGSVQAAAGATWQTWWSAGIAVSAVAAFAGIAFPRLWLLELLAKIALVALVADYIMLYVAAGFTDSNVTATAGLMVILILLPLWRVGFIAKWKGLLRRLGR